MSRARPVGSWSARDTDSGAVEAAIGRLRERHGGGALRSAVTTLVALVDDDAVQARQATQVVRELSERMPVRALVVATVPDAGQGIDAQVTVRQVRRPGGDSVCVEDILIRVRGDVRGHLDYAVEPFTLAGLPVVVWLPARLPAADEPLVAEAECLLMDSGAPHVGASLAGLVDLSRHLPVADLSWIRLDPWRHALATLFVGAEFGPFLNGVCEIDVRGAPGPRVLLAGWLASRLRIAPGGVRLAEAEETAVRVSAAEGGRRAQFAVARESGDLHVSARAAIEGGASHRRTVVLPARSVAWLIAQALGRPGRDAVWEEAISVGVELSDPDRGGRTAKDRWPRTT